MFMFQCLEVLGKAFGNTTNEKGFKMLPPYLRVIQGDGISYKTIGMLQNFVVTTYALK